LYACVIDCDDVGKQTGAKVHGTTTTTTYHRDYFQAVTRRLLFSRIFHTVIC